LDHFGGQNHEKTDRTTEGPTSVAPKSSTGMGNYYIIITFCSASM